MWIIGTIAVVILAGGAYLYLKRRKPVDVKPSSETSAAWQKGRKDG